MLLMVEKGIRGGICYAIHRYAKANNKYMNHIIIPHVFRCKQFVWIGNVSKIACKWIKMLSERNSAERNFIVMSAS